MSKYSDAEIQVELIAMVRDGLLTATYQGSPISAAELDKLSTEDFNKVVLKETQS